MKQKKYEKDVDKLDLDMVQEHDNCDYEFVFVTIRRYLIRFYMQNKI